MSAVATRLVAGDVIEVQVAGESATALVLLVSADAVILDACDGSTPFVMRTDELGDVRIFDGLSA